MRLSVAMITRDEARALPTCLGSIQGLWDELVVLDTGSSDGTPDLAAAAGARVARFDWTEDFSAARNASLALCTGDWILVLDADEGIDPLDHALIRQACAAGNCQAFRLELRNYLRGGAFMTMDGGAVRNDGRYPLGRGHSHYSGSPLLRLFRNQGEPVYSGRIHEIPDPWFEQRGLAIGALGAVIHHFGKLDLARDLAKQGRYLALAKAEAAADPGNLQMHYNVIQEGLMVKDWEAVLASAERYRAGAPRAPMLVWMGGGLALQALGRHEEAFPWFQNILATRPDHPVALTARADSLAALGRHPEAQEAWLRAMTSDPGYTLSFLHLSSNLDAQGDAASARRVLEAGLDQNPQDAVLWEALVGLSAAHCDARVAADAWDALRAVPAGGQGIWHLLVIHALRASGAPEQAEEVRSLGLKAFPGNEELLRA